MVSTVGHRIDYNGVGTLRGQRQHTQQKLTQVTPRGRRRFVEIIRVFLESSTKTQSTLISEFSFQPKSKLLVKRIVPLFLTPNFFHKKIHKQTRILLFHLKKIIYAEALPMFLIWRENLLSYDNMRVFFFARSGGQMDVICHEKNIQKILLDLLRK